MAGRSEPPFSSNLICVLRQKYEARRARLNHIRCPSVAYGLYRSSMTRGSIVGVLALQGAFYEHIKLLRNASCELISDADVKWEFIEVRTPSELAKCDALIIPGGESTTVSLVAERSNLLEPLREFVKYVCARNTEACMPFYVYG